MIDVSISELYVAARAEHNIRDSIAIVAAQLDRDPLRVAVILGFPPHYGAPKAEEPKPEPKPSASTQEGAPAIAPWPYSSPTAPLRSFRVIATGPRGGENDNVVTEDRPTLTMAVMFASSLLFLWASRTEIAAEKNSFVDGANEIVDAIKLLRSTTDEWTLRSMIAKTDEVLWSIRIVLVEDGKD